MARRIRSTALETRTARLRLPVRKKPHAFTTFAPGIALGYRRCQGAGRWVVRVADGHGGAWIKNVGLADDYEAADNEHVFDFWGAQERARRLARGQDSDNGRPVTVAEAIADYERDLEKRGGEVANATRARWHLTPALLAKPVSLLAPRELRRWRDGLALKPATVNRTVKAVKAALNLAAAHDPRITNREAWRIGLAGLPDAHTARNVILPDHDVLKLVATAYAVDPALGLLVEVAAVTGARVGQITALEINDLQDGRDDPRLLMPSSRKGKGRKRIERRPVPIPAGLAAKLRAAAGDRRGCDRLLLKGNCTPWRSEISEHLRPFAEAAKRAGFAGVTIYSLRHSSIVRALLAGLPVRLVGGHHDTSIAMIERSYSEHILDHTDALTRRALLDPAAPPADNVVRLSGRS